jgi:hypothetical protein
MLEDYWLPRRDGSRGTEITTLPAGQNLGELADVEYFQKKLYESLNVPTTRLQQDGAFIFGQDQEVSRDEIKFGKFIDRLRMRFNHLFLEALKKQLLLKNVMMEEDWEAIESNVKFDYTKDNYFEQQKTTTVMRDRLTTLDQLQPYIGKYYSNEWVRKHVLYQSDEEIEEMDEQNMSEQENPLYKQQVDEGGNTVQGGNAPPGQNNPQGPGGGGFGSVAPTEQFN